jgi:hypothetical protein
MKKSSRILVTLLLCASGFLITHHLHAKKVLESLDFSTGRWVMIGVSLHNYQPLPIQSEVGTFIVKEPVVLKKIQDKWDFEEKYDDFCDYHYALKFYQNGELQLTLRANLHCNYITLGGFSYEYSQAQFEEFKMYFTPIRWSRIRYENMDLLQKAMGKLDKAPGVYWYGDVQQYNFKGQFLIEQNGVPWNADRDSLAAEMTDRIREKMGGDDFYVDVWAWYLSDDWNTMDLRFNVYCDEPFYKKYKEDNVLIGWRSHLSEQNFIQIVVIGLNKEEYFKLMQGA